MTPREDVARLPPFRLRLRRLRLARLDPTRQRRARRRDPRRLLGVARLRRVARKPPPRGRDAPQPPSRHRRPRGFTLTLAIRDGLVDRRAPPVERGGRSPRGAPPRLSRGAIARPLGVLLARHRLRRRSRRSEVRLRGPTLGGGDETRLRVPRLGIRRSALRRRLRLRRHRARLLRGVDARGVRRRLRRARLGRLRLGGFGGALLRQALAKRRHLGVHPLAIRRDALAELLTPRQGRGGGGRGGGVEPRAATERPRRRARGGGGRRGGGVRVADAEVLSAVVRRRVPEVGSRGRGGPRGGLRGDHRRAHGAGSSEGVERVVRAPPRRQLGSGARDASEEPAPSRRDGVRVVVAVRLGARGPGVVEARAEEAPSGASVGSLRADELAAA